MMRMPKAHRPIALTELNARQVKKSAFSSGGRLGSKASDDATSAARAYYQADGDSVNDRRNKVADLANQDIDDIATAKYSSADDGSGFQAVYDDPTASEAEKTAALEAYFKARYGSRFKVLEPAFLALKRIFFEIGANPNENPFVTYLDNFVERNPNGSLSVPGVDALNNLYADRDIDPDDLRGTTKDGASSVLFNDSLMKEDEEDVEETVNSYVWLTDPSNVSKVNFDAIYASEDPIVKSSGIRGDIEAMADIDAAASKLSAASPRGLSLGKITNRERRDMIVFENGDPTNAVRPRSTIDAILRVGSSKRNSSARRRDKITPDSAFYDFTKSFNAMSDSDKRDFMSRLSQFIDSSED